MHRIDTVNARPNQNGVGKPGFNDNTDLAGQDATYVSPEWCNALQEELANVIEQAEIELNKSQNNQLLTALTTLFAAKAGSDTQVFKVQNGSNAKEAVNKGQLDAAANEAAQDTYDLSAAMQDQLDALNAAKAAKNGDENQFFQVKDGVAAKDAVNKGQLNNEAYDRQQADSQLQQQINDLSSTTVPTGSVTAFAGTAAPNGWLECNGGAVSRTGFAALFAAIGTAWGIGDGSTTFNLPDGRGEFIRGWDHGRGVDGGRDVGSWQEATSISPQVVGHAIVDIRDADSEITDGAVGNSGAGVNPAFDRTFKRVRPRNIAMMYIIKA